MTKLQRIESALKSAGGAGKTVDDLLAFAYYLGAHRSAKRICDEHNKRAAAAVQRLQTVRYWIMANTVLGDTVKTIYDGDYSDDYTAEFGTDRLA